MLLILPMRLLPRVVFAIGRPELGCSLRDVCCRGLLLNCWCAGRSLLSWELCALGRLFCGKRLWLGRFLFNRRRRLKLPLFGILDTLMVDADEDLQKSFLDLCQVAKC